MFRLQNWYCYRKLYSSRFFAERPGALPGRPGALRETSGRAESYPSSAPTPVSIPTWPRQYGGETRIYPCKGAHMGGHARASIGEKYVWSPVKGPTPASVICQGTHSGLREPKWPIWESGNLKKTPEIFQKRTRFLSAPNPSCSRFERRLVREAKKTDFFEVALFRVKIGPFIYYFN